MRALTTAARTLLRHRGFTATVIVAMGIAIAVNATMYGVLDAMLNPTAAGVHPERLFNIRYFGDRQHVFGEDAIADALQSGLRSYEAVSGYRPDALPATVGVGRQETPSIWVRPNFFQVMGLRPLEGRLTPVFDGDGARSVVISDRLRGQLFPNGNSAIGQTIALNGRIVHVVGVVRRYVAFSALDTDVWLFAEPGRDTVPVNLLRVRAGAARADVDRELRPLAARLAVAAGEAPRDTRFYLSPITRQFRIDGFQFALTGAVLAILLIACANLANLQMTRGANRGRELAVRSSLGARRRDLIALVCVETALLAIAGLMVGLLLTVWGIDVLRTVIPPSASYSLMPPQWSWRTAIAAVGVTMVCFVLVGVLPAIYLSAVDAGAFLKQGGATGRHRRSSAWSGVLIAVQIGLALPVLINALSLSRAAWRDLQTDYHVHRLLGYDPDSLVVGRLVFPSVRGSFVHVSDIAANLVAVSRRTRGVTNAAAMLVAQPDGAGVQVTRADGETDSIPTPIWSYRLVSPSYLRTFGLPIAEGRDFTEGAYAVPVVIVDLPTRIFVFPNERLANQRMKFGAPASSAPWNAVIGVAGDWLDAEGRSRRSSVDTLRLSTVYKVLSLGDSVRSGRNGVEITIYARVAGNPNVVAAALQRNLMDAYPGVVPRVSSLRDDLGISAQVASDDLVSVVFLVFATLCLGLVVLGVYAMVSQTAAQMHRELAVRASLGAAPRDIVHLVLRDGRIVALAGIAHGLFLTFVCGGWLGAFVGEADLSAVPSFAGVALALCAVAGSVASISARRATRIDLVEALRGD